jgi:hypothetical protein
MLGGAKFHDGRAGAAVDLAGEGKREHFGMSLEQGMNSALQISYALSMDYSDFENTLLLANAEIIQHDLFDLAWDERVQVQNAVDRQRDRVAELIVRRFH